MFAQPQSHAGDQSTAADRDHDSVEGRTSLFSDLGRNGSLPEDRQFSIEGGHVDRSSTSDVLLCRIVGSLEGAAADNNEFDEVAAQGQDPLTLLSRRIRRNVDPGVDAQLRTTACDALRVVSSTGAHDTPRPVLR